MELAAECCVLPVTRCVPAGTRCVLPVTRCVPQETHCVLRVTRCVPAGTRRVLRVTRRVPARTHCVPACISESKMAATSHAFRNWALHSLSLPMRCCCHL